MSKSFHVLTISDPCSSGDIRLWGGQTEYEGNIEICTDHGVWSAVCDRYWDNIDATVACRQLNYTSFSKGNKVMCSNAIANACRPE